jgi:hypothetical protein
MHSLLIDINHQYITFIYVCVYIYIIYTEEGKTTSISEIQVWKASGFSRPPATKPKSTKRSRTASSTSKAKNPRKKPKGADSMQGTPAGQSPTSSTASETGSRSGPSKQTKRRAAQRKSGPASDSSKRGKSTGTSELDTEVTPEQMQDLSKAVGSNWHDIGVYLDLSFNDLDDIEQRKKSLSDRLLEVLRKWKDDKGKAATVGVLMRACEKTKVLGAAKRALFNQ